MLTIKLAFRNLFRNTRRSILTILLIGFSLSALILTDSIMRGMINLMVENVTQTLNGEAQLHQVGYRDNRDVDLYMKNSTKLLETLQRDPAVKTYSARVISGAMISSTYNVTAGLLYGVDAERELSMSKVSQAIVGGSYLTGGKNELLMGQEMAELLEVGIGDRIVITLSQVDTGELTQALYRISGLLHFGVRELDTHVVFANIDAARQVLGMEIEQSHEISFKFHDRKLAEDPNHAIFTSLNNEEIEALGWLELNKEIGLILEMSSYSAFIVGLILFLLATLGVINSMFMSIYERIYEFGVLKAIGARPISLANLILCEAFLLAVCSCLFGMILSYLVGSWTAVHGVPMGEAEFSGIAISNNILTELHISQFVNFPIYVVILTVVAALYPARFAAKIVPTEALQRSL